MCFPVAGNNAGKFPAQPVDYVGVGVILNGADVGSHCAHPCARFFLWQVLGKALFAVGIQNQFARKRFVSRSRDIEYGGIDLQIAAGGTGLVENLCKKARAQAVHRVTARHAVGDGVIAGNPREQVQTTMDNFGGSAKISLLKERAGMGERVYLDGQSFLQPRLGLGVIGFKGISHDADGCPPVYVL